MKNHFSRDSFGVWLVAPAAGALMLALVACAPAAEVGRDEDAPPSCQEPEAVAPIVPAEACTVLTAEVPPDQEFPLIEEVTSPFEAAAGGVIRPGVYRWSKDLVFGPAAPIEPGSRQSRRGVLAIGGATWFLNDGLTAGGALSTDEATQSLNLEMDCPVSTYEESIVNALTFPFGFGGAPNSYTATCDTLVVDLVISAFTCGDCVAARRVFTREL